jgi:hypothetical protein
VEAISEAAAERFPAFLYLMLAFSGLVIATALHCTALLQVILSLVCSVPTSISGSREPAE